MLTELRKFAESNPHLVTVRPSVRYPKLSVVKYRRRVFRDALWTPELQEMRGLVVDSDWRPIVRPFTKVFNRGEAGTDFDRDDDVVAVTKINGFMAAYTRDPTHGNIISTTGSLDSDFADLARQHLSWLDGAMVPEGLTLLWEIVDPTDPHIIPQQVGAWLIGARWVNSGDVMDQPKLDAMALELGDRVLRPHHFVARFGEVVSRARACRHEGFMVYRMTDGAALKIKSPYYLVNKLVARLSEKKFNSNWIMTPAAKQIIDEEYYDLLEHVRENVELFRSLDEQARLKFLRDFLRR